MYVKTGRRTSCVFAHPKVVKAKEKGTFLLRYS
jgi:hypothetical protein